MDKIRQNIVIGALLHDIGKFVQRSEENRSLQNSSKIKDETKRILPDICPQYNGRFSHLHSAWTYQFFNDYDQYLFKNDLSGDVAAINIAAHHHHPSTLIQEIIQKSDWLSAGMDRSKCKDVMDEISDETSRKYNFRKQRLQPVFENIFSKDYHSGRNSEERLRYEIAPLELDDTTVFPQNFLGEDKDLNDDYLGLWGGFITEFKNLPNAEFGSFVNTLLPLLQKYTWCIPSSTHDIPDISLYDHLRTTAAISLCYYDFIKDKFPKELAAENTSIVRGLFDGQYSNEEFATIICGDLSGIQSFIYQIASHRAAKSLKGRSFIIQLLSDTCAEYMLEQLGLPETNLVYSSGGKFFILAPNTQNTVTVLEKVKNQLNTGLLAKYSGSIYLGVGQSTLTAQDFLDSLNEKWVAAIHNSAKTKSQRFVNQMLTDDTFFLPMGDDADIKQCTICGLDVKKTDLITQKDNPDKQWCRTCDSIIATGAKLKSADYLVKLKSMRGDYIPLDNIDVSYILMPEDKLKQVYHDYKESIVKIYKFNDTEFMPDKEISLFDKGFGYKFYGGNDMPTDKNGDIADFNKLAGERDDVFKRLGILRMDVDNLGLIFQKGFDFDSHETDSTGSFYSISRLSTLSNMLDIFFSGYLNEIAFSDKYNRKLFIVYSGGDDIFMVGRWYHLIDCALEIYDTFKKFVCNHPRFTISGGMEMVPQKFPIHRAADLAGNAEDKAKAYQYKTDDKEKDAFTFLGKSLSWHDLKLVQQIKDELLENEEQAKNKGLLNRLRRIQENYKNQKDILDKNKDLSPKQRAELVQYNKWRWRMVYDLARYKKENKQANALIDKLQEAMLDGDHYGDLNSLENIQDFIDLPARWTELINRSNK